LGQRHDKWQVDLDGIVFGRLPLRNRIAVATEGLALPNHCKMNTMNLADTMNQACLCRPLSPQRLQEQLETDPSLHGMTAALTSTHPHLFSQTAVFLDSDVHTTLARTVAAIDRVMALPAYQQFTLAQAGPIAQHDFGPLGAFMGYDFHVSAQGPRLIEINTNAGGAFLNAALARAHRACCGAMEGLMDASGDLTQLDAVFIDMFRHEWRSQRATQPLRTVLIVDDAPATQYMAPEFELARQLFQSHGLHAVVADAAALQYRDGALWHPALPAGVPVDLVYNRLTDFDLSEPGHAALHDAYGAGATVVTPHPRAHALYAHKRNLITLGDDAQLAAWGVGVEDRALLQAAIPRTTAVTAENADALWANRRQLFFKPVAGYGGKAAYRGEKLTKRVWGDIVAGGFIAQDWVPPSERLVEVDGEPKQLKLDVRAYTYNGHVQLLAARTYSGQTTNMRTPGGGFCPVVVLPSLSLPTHNEPVVNALGCAC